MIPGTPPALADDRPLIVERTWPPAARSVGRARRVLADHLCAWGLPHLTDSAELIVSELVTNAVNHAHPPHGRLIFTRFERLECGVRIEVHDTSEAKPELRDAARDEESGRGLLLVEALTGGHWGVSDRNGPGKTVWAVCADGETRDATAEATR